MWLSKRSRQRQEPESAAEMGTVTVATGGVGVYAAREQRALPVFGPGGYAWRPMSAQQVLVVKTGAAGEAPCVAGARQAETGDLNPGEVSITGATGDARIVLRNDGTVELTGQVLVNGAPVMTQQEVPDGGADA